MAILILAGTIIAYLVITTSETTDVDFVSDIAGGSAAPSALGPMATLLPIMGMVIGASFIGADIRSGMLEQLLTWEPRRMRLFAARLMSAAWGTGVIAIVIAVWEVAALYGLAATAGTTGGATTEVWVAIAANVLRSAAITGLFSVLGISITLLLNNSVGAIVGFLSYWFVIENIVLSLFLPKVSAYLPVGNASAFGTGQPIQRFEGNVFTMATGEPVIVEVHDYRMAGLLALGYVAAACVGAAIVFRQRDIG